MKRLSNFLPGKTASKTVVVRFKILMTVHIAGIIVHVSIFILIHHDKLHAAFWAIARFITSYFRMHRAGIDYLFLRF